MWKLKQQNANFVHADNLRHLATQQAVGHHLHPGYLERGGSHANPGYLERGGSHANPGYFERGGSHHEEAPPYLYHGGARLHLHQEDALHPVPSVVADVAIPAGAAKVVSALAEEAFFLQLEDTASFITSTIGVLDSLELKYAKLPSVPELDIMDQTCPKLLDQPTFKLDKLVSPIAQSKLVTSTKVPASLDPNNNLLVLLHPTPRCLPGPPLMKQRGSWSPVKSDTWWTSNTPVKPDLSTTIASPALRKKEREAWWPVGWYPDWWYSSTSLPLSRSTSPGRRRPRTGGTTGRRRRTSGPA